MITPRLLPAVAASGLDYFTDRLADLSVLEDSVAVRLGKPALLAVAVGGQRRGGYLSVDLLTTAVAVAELLAGRPGFPDVRVRWSLYRDTCHVVEWGEPPPEPDDVARGRFYGYGEAAITAFIGPAVPDELALLRRIFGPEEPPFGHEPSQGGSCPPHGAAAGERMFRFDDAGPVRGVPMFWAQCRTCDAEGPEAGTAETASVWPRTRPRQPGSPSPFRLLSAAPVRIAPISGHSRWHLAVDALDGLSPQIKRRNDWP